MDYTGYTRKFPNNRPLNAFEREHRLLQKKRLDVVPLAQLCVVKMNSNGWFRWIAGSPRVALQPCWARSALPLGWAAC